MSLLVRYFAGAVAAAGIEEETLDLPAGSTVTSLVDALADRHGSRLGRVLASCTLLVDEVAGGRDRSLDGARQVDVLPPFAGGA
jgi:sulfur-carrier protein